MPGFYEARMLNLFNKYNIKDNAQRILKAHEDWKTGRIDEAELGRLIRLSPENRSTIIQTMVKTAGIMQKKPEESKYILEIIETCGEIVSIADKPLPSVGFPNFLKLPIEIRHRIYRYYFNLNKPKTIMVPYAKRAKCQCDTHESYEFYDYHNTNMNLAFASKQMRDEVLGYFYNRYYVYFCCTCEMACQLRNNSFMKQHIRKIKFIWCGRDTDKNIIELRDCLIEDMIVMIAKFSLVLPSKRERMLEQCFNRAGRFKKGFPEVLGFDELSSLRGFRSVEVESINGRKAETCTNEERTGLQRWLQRLKQPREDQEAN
ncbi:hypothetical protein BX600DRAFT_509190 [Xylariales sp. PMI_506]|nr:hypothetical protein BX600DRAFT_509190 [Xylariales sp. PMI_506]